MENNSYLNFEWFELNTISRSTTNTYHGQLKFLLANYYKTTIYEVCETRYTKTPKKKEEKLLNLINKYYTDKNLQAPVKFFKSYNKDADEPEWFLTENAFFQINAYSKSYYVTLVTTEEELTILVKDFLKKNGFSNPKPKPNIYLLGSGREGLRLIRLEDGIESKFYADHYNDHVVDKRIRVLRDLKSKEPIGRITLIEGVPGTGKTHCIRSIISDLTECVYIFIPPTLVGSLTGPDLITLLSDVSRADKPIVLVIEDGDNCLVPRGPDNISSISALLNITDGIVGCALDIRAIVTTNAKITDVDPAIMRPGRLSEHIAIDKLSMEKAQLLYKKLTKDVDAFYSSEDTTLAAIYAKAKDFSYENKNAIKKEKKIGF